MFESVIIDTHENAELRKFLIEQIKKYFPKATIAANLIKGQDRYMSFHDENSDKISGWTNNSQPVDLVKRRVKNEREFYDGLTELDKIYVWLEWEFNRKKPVPFTIAEFSSKILEDGSVKVGCTTITKAEVENFIQIYQSK
jgi:hypothetical protein